MTQNQTTNYVKMHAICRSDDCPSTIQQEEFKHCDKCNRKFKDDQCLQNHIDRKVCSKYFKCKHCDVLCSVPMLKRYKTSHVCGTTLCKMCKMQYYKVTILD